MFGQTPFILTKFPSAYLLVEINTNKVPLEYKEKIMTILKSYTDELGINTKGYSQRAMAIIIDRMGIGKNLVLRTRLLVGEDVKRLDDGEEVFAILSVSNRISGKAFSEKDLNIIGGIAIEAAVAVKNAKIYRQLNKKLLELGTLHEVGKTLGTVLEIGKLLDLILDLTARDL